MQLPINIRRTRQCPRCGLDYAITETVCPHCKGLSERELETLKQQYQADAAGERHLGWMFIYIAMLIVVGLVIFAFAGRHL